MCHNGVVECDYQGHTGYGANRSVTAEEESSASFDDTCNTWKGACSLLFQRHLDTMQNDSRLVQRMRRIKEGTNSICGRLSKETERVIRTITLRILCCNLSQTDAACKKCNKVSRNVKTESCFARCSFVQVGLQQILDNDSSSFHRHQEAHTVCVNPHVSTCLIFRAAFGQEHMLQGTSCVIPVFLPGVFGLCNKDVLVVRPNSYWDSQLYPLLYVTRILVRLFRQNRLDASTAVPPAASILVMNVNVGMGDLPLYCNLSKRNTR